MSSAYSIWKEASDQLDKLFEAKAKALGAMKNAPRTCKSHYGMYADLATIWDTIRKPLSENGLDVIQSFAPYGEDGGIMLVTTLGHSSGQFIRSFLPIKGNLQPQALAATATYLKRIELAAIVGVAAEDEDDGEMAERAATVASVEDEARVERIGTQKLKEAKTSSERAEILAKAEKRVFEGTLSQGALDRLKKVAQHQDAEQAAGTEARKDRKPSAVAMT